MISEHRQPSMYPVRKEFAQEVDFSTCICDMCHTEGTLEKVRRELAIQSDFNICDSWNMFTRLNKNKTGIDAEDLFYTAVNNLGMEITKDEIFMIFFSLDRDGDGMLDQVEITDCFMPKEMSYAKILNSRGGLYGKEKDLRKIFLQSTRECLVRFIRGFVECEMSLEKIRQRMTNKLEVEARQAFEAIDTSGKGFILLEDIV
jgi:hypothetical protein